MAKVVINDANLTDIADAIRKKSGTEDTYKPSEMATAIQKIQTATGLPSPTEDELVFSENMGHWDVNGIWDWFIEKYKEYIIIKDVTSSANMFEKSKLKKIPIDINFKSDETQIINYIFLDSLITEIPKLKNVRISYLRSAFYGCYYLQEMPESCFENWEYSNLKAADNLFNNCYSLRRISPVILSELKVNSSSTYDSLFYYGFRNCYVLDEIVNLNFPVTYTSNAFLNTFEYNCRLKDMIFETNEDGTAKTAKWKNQVINLSTYLGYVDSKSKILNYNSGITADKEVKDDETYQALKDNPDWFSRDVAYSRYNHDSAVRTINSLPDTSEYLATAGGTNTIKFIDNAGSATDGGAINTLTEEEIAVATAKGWTVTLV